MVSMDSIAGKSTCGMGFKQGSAFTMDSSWMLTMADRNRARARSETERFFEHVALPDENGCHRWMGWVDRDGYGRFTLADRSGIRAHRWVYIREHGSIPEGLCVCHACDVPSCVNPAHLWLGSNQENTRDRNSKGRQATGKKVWESRRTVRGQRVNTSRLTPDQVREVRAAAIAGSTHREQAERLGVTQAAIRFIVIRKNWKWLP